MDRRFPQNSTLVPPRKFSWICTPFLDSTFLLEPYPPCTIGSHGPPRDSSCVRMQSSDGGALDIAFAAWIGQPVILQVALGDIRVPLRGKLLKDSGETLRMRIGEGWDVDIYKAMVMAVEQDSMATTLPS